MICDVVDPKSLGTIEAKANAIVLGGHERSPHTRPSTTMLVSTTRSGSREAIHLLQVPAQGARRRNRNLVVSVTLFQSQRMKFHTSCLRCLVLLSKVVEELFSAQKKES
jgi:hypothetical protein